jgi:hypothetical protein
LKNYYDALGEDAWKVLPLTFEIDMENIYSDLEQITQSKDFLDAQGAEDSKYWIIKPGSNSNR